MRDLRPADHALLRFLVRHGTISRESCAQYVQLATERALGISEVLEQENVLGDRDLAELLSCKLRLATVDLGTHVTDPAAAAALREELAAQYNVVPLRATADSLEIATANPLDVDAIQAIEFATGRHVTILVATRSDIRAAMHGAYDAHSSVERFIGDLQRDDDIVVADLSGEAIDLRTLAQDAERAPVVRLADVILSEGIRGEASDIHIEPTPDGVLVRYRVDGVLEEGFRFPKAIQLPLASRLKIMSRLDITERRVPQDGRLRVRYQGREIDLRVSTLPTQHGEKVTMRILDAGRSVRPLEQLGLSPLGLSRLREAARRPQGMILVTGPTGSGKTTTLYALLRELQSGTTNIVTIENPIEYQLAGISQVDINQRQGLTFASVLRSVLRQDPDVILVGEIRDEETARIAFQAAQTGHLVLSTLHTNDAVAALTRLADLGIESHVLASSLNAVVAQRLVRATCEHCRDTYDPEPDTIRLLGLASSRVVFLRGQGCDACRETGYGGRIGVYEIVTLTPTLAKLVESHAGETVVRRQSRSEGFGSVLDDAREKLQAGITTAEEILRVVQLDHVPDEVPEPPTGVASLIERFGDGSSPAAEPQAPVPRPLAREIAPAAEPRTFRVLVIDDHPAMRQLTRTNLETAGMPLIVCTAQNGAEGLALAASDPPDLVILDIGLPDIDGYEICRRLRARPATAAVAVLMITGRGGDDDLEQGFDAGTDDYLVKPYRRADLLARVRRMLTRANGEEALPPPPARPQGPVS